MRVLIVNPIGTLGGSEQSLLDLVWSLRRAAPELELRLMCLGEGELAPRAARLGVEAETLVLPAPLARLGETGRAASRLRALVDTGRGALLAPGFVRRLRARVKQLNPSVVHTNGMKAHLIAAAALRGLPLVVHLRDFPAERRVSRRLFDFLPRDRAIVVANSRAVGRETEALRSELRVRVVENGIDTQKFMSAGHGVDLAELSGLPPLAEGGIAVGLVATYAFWKGHDLFLEAAARLVRAELGRPLRFYVVGGPIYGTHGSERSRADLEAMVRKLGLQGKVGLVPFQTEVERVYPALDVVVHASTRPEPFGRTIVEAMAAGRPVVVARAGGAAELFDEGRTGLGFTPGDASDLTRVLGSLVADRALRSRLGLAAAAEAASRFDRARLGPALVDVYRELLGARP